MKKRTQFPFLPPTFTVKILDLKSILILLLFGFFSTYTQAQDFNISVTLEGGAPTGYCDITSFTININNTGGASTFTGRVKFYTLLWRIIDNSELPNLVVTTDNPNSLTHFDFTTPTIGAGKSVSYEYQLLSTPFEENNPKRVENDITRDANTYLISVDKLISSSEIEPIPQPDSTSIRISDLLDDNLPEGSGPAALFHLDENTLSAFFDTNDTLSQSIYVEDELICDIEAYSIYNGQGTGLIVMEEGATIIVEDGSTLTIDGQSISSCQKMWKGIYVEEGGRLNLNNCIIANAQYGIRAERGATIVSNGTVFQDCYVGLYVSPYTYAQDPEHPEETYVNTNSFIGNLFIGSGTMLPPYSGQSPAPEEDLPWAGIEINNVSSFVLPGSASDVTANAFENLTNGIIVRNSSVSIGDAFFLDIEYNTEISLKTQGYGIFIEDGKYSKIYGNTIGTMTNYDYHFENVTQAIYNSKGAIDVSGMTMANVNIGIQIQDVTNRRISIIDNYIEGFYKGIMLNHSMPIEIGEITDNEILISREATANYASCIEMNDYPVPARWLIENNIITVKDAKYGVYNVAGDETTIMNNTIDVVYLNEDAGHGIFLKGTNNAVVTCNSITGDIADPEFHHSSGINFDAVHSYNISCNDITDFRWGIKVSSDNKGLLAGNILTDHYHGLYLGSGARSGIQDHTGNKWDGIYEEEAARHDGNINDQLGSLFLVDMSTPSDYKPTTVFPASGWFINEAGSPYSCVDSLICPEGTGHYSLAPTWDSLDIDVIDGDIGFDNFDAPKSWNTRIHLYRRLKGETVPGLPASISTFLSTQQDSNIGKFANAYDSLFYAIKYHGPQESVLVEYPSHLSRIFEDVIYLDSLIVTDRYNNDSLTTLMVARYDSIFHYEYNYLQKDSSINVLLGEKIDNAIDYIDDIDPDSSWQEELQFTLLEFLNLAKTDTLLSSTDLYDLANRCPDKYGDPVYHARSLIRQDSLKNYYDEDDLCDYVNPRTTKFVEIQSGFLYPNPASTEIQIESKKDIKEIHAYTLSGSEVQLESQILDNRAIINVSTLPSGLYHLRSFDNSGGVEFFKFVIVRR